MARFWMLATALAVLTGIGPAAMSSRSAAMGFCNCCETNLTQTCDNVCAAITLKFGICPSIVNYEKTATARKGTNPLNGMSLKAVTLGEPSPGQLERFRRFMEKGRRQAVRSYRKALCQYKRHRISEADLASADALYKEALVNYYHGIRAYLNRVGTKSD